MVTEKRLIDANAIPWEEHYVPDPDRNAQWDFKKEWTVLKPVIDQMPTVDAVEVIRCKDCKHYRNHPNGLCFLWTEPYDNAKGYKGDIHCVEPDDYCSFGERK